MQMRHVVPDDGGVHVLGPSGFPEGAGGSGTPHPHPLSFRLGEISKTRSMSAGFHQKVTEINRACATGSLR
ncbi:hypothetical protein PV336_27730 [Streptomyces sp. MI02-2A]|nr:MULTISPECIES: hypothetical protein [unclassified Streptomyces]MDX3262972.1 hypothetical protein [Streptomyces sp. MI02-2A]